MRKTALAIMAITMCLSTIAQTTFPLSIGGGVNNVGNTNVNLEIGVAPHYPTVYPTFAFQYSKNKKTGYFEYLVGAKLHYMIGDEDNRQSFSVGLFRFTTDNYKLTQETYTEEGKETTETNSPKHLVVQLGYRFLYRVSPYYQTPAYLSFAPNLNVWPKASVQINVAWVVIIAPKKRGCCNNNVMIN